METTLAARSPRLKNKFKKSEGAATSEVPTYEKLIPVTNDSMLQVYVSAVADPTHFWLQLISPRAVELDHLVDNMTDYYKKEENRELHKLNG
uniref:Tudor domain-containing protein n=4 Tax=Rhodnius TaxID=13248 RepID=T1I276_RHOPR